MDAEERLHALAAFIEQHHLLIYTHVASIFDARDGKLVLSEAEGTAWAILPSEWRAWALEHSNDAAERQIFLQRLAKGTAATADMPASLRDFMDTCSALSLDRTCSDGPILTTAETGAAMKRPVFQFDALGMKSKKAHEVERCLGMVHDLTGGRQGPHILDIGAGRAHLSRALTRDPINAHVLAVDSSGSQLDGSDRLLDLTNRFNGPLGLLSPPKGSLKHELNHLNRESLGELLSRWPPKSAEPCTVFCLHGCGDLTVNTLRAMVETTRKGRKQTACIVGCCYNLLSESNFPISRHLSGTMITLGRDARMLAAQAPSHWVLDDNKRPGTMLSLRKLAMRARLGAELCQSGCRDDSRNERVGRPPDSAYSSYAAFRAIALDRLGMEPDLPALEVNERDWNELQFAVAFFWLLRALLGPVIESLIVLDRFLYLADALKPSPDVRVELHALFDQRKESLRNLALVIR